MSRRGQYVNDLTPFFDDGCWMFVLLARDAKVGVILRRGPTRWWHVTRWDTRTDQFEKGQWFHGRIYPDQCDLSPDGKLFVYFAGKWRARARDLGYGDVWTAVSRPPYLTALALWPDTSTYGGGGIFFDNQSVQVGWPGLHHHPDHPPGPLLVNPALVPPPPRTLCHPRRPIPQALWTARPRPGSPGSPRESRPHHLLSLPECSRSHRPVRISLGRLGSQGPPRRCRRRPHPHRPPHERRPSSLAPTG